MKKNEVGFILRKISTEQFATIEIDLSEKENVQLGFSVNFGINEENRIIACSTRFEFLAKNSPFILIHIKCEFDIEPKAWENYKNIELKKISFPKGFMSHLAVITVGAARGVLHAKTENTKFNQYLLPTINVTDFVKEDISFDLS
ncbi:MAG: hypothetical protein K9H16_04905 [Bacteroidales bacterium]|nr:hypothetical protein [Bacteroidales bacterium]